MFRNIVEKFRTVSGVLDKFVKDAIRENPNLPLQFITSEFQQFHSVNLRNAFFKEINLYLDKALYQYILSKDLLHKGKFSWGAITQYYANYFTISGLIRLHEYGFSRIVNVDIELQYDNSSNIYKIKKIKNEGLHRIVWKTFYTLYKNFDYKPSIFYIVYTPIKNNDIYFESNRRNDLNYNPGIGYNEIYSAQNAILKQQKELLVDAYSNCNIVKINDWIDVDNMTQYRIRLLANIIAEIDKLSEFPYHVKERFVNRKNLIHRNEKDKRYRERFVGWLEGE